MSEMTENIIIYIFFVMSLFLATGSSIVIYEKAAKDIWTGISGKKCFFIIGAVRLMIGIVEIAIISASPTEYGEIMKLLACSFSSMIFVMVLLIKMKPENVSITYFLLISLFVIISQLMAWVGKNMILSTNLISADTEIRYLEKYATDLTVCVMAQKAIFLVIDVIEERIWQEKSKK